MSKKNSIHKYAEYIQENYDSPANFVVEGFADFIQNKIKSLEDKLKGSQEKIKTSTEKAKESSKKAANFKDKMGKTKDPISKKIYANRASEEQMKAQIYAEKMKMHQMNMKLAQSELSTADLKKTKKETPPKE
jgi:hypothetical protein